MSQKSKQQTFLSPPPHHKLGINNTQEKNYFEDKPTAHELLSLKHKEPLSKQIQTHVNGNKTHLCESINIWT